MRRRNLRIFSFFSPKMLELLTLAPSFVFIRLLGLRTLVAHFYGGEHKLQDNSWVSEILTSTTLLTYHFIFLCCGVLNRKERRKKNEKMYFNQHKTEQRRKDR